MYDADLGGFVKQEQEKKLNKTTAESCIHDQGILASGSEWNYFVNQHASQKVLTDDMQPSQGLENAA